MQLNETHNPDLRSWVASANDGLSDFPIQNLPYAVFRPRNSMQPWRIGIAIGDQVLDMGALARSVDAVHLDEVTQKALSACRHDALNELMALGGQAWSALRRWVSASLAVDAPLSTQEWLRAYLLPQLDVEYRLPAQIGDYTDFYMSIHHATHVGQLFRPDQPLMPNYHWLPIAYHGRSSSVAVSGTNFHRPKGQIKAPTSSAPVLGASQKMDYELELGVWVGTGNAAGEAIELAQAESHVFGLCVLNDWSARDIQAWEYQPLGPFLGKNFATTVSPWVVTLEALAPYRDAWQRPAEHVAPLAYLDHPSVREHGGLDIQMHVHLQTEALRQEQRWVQLSSSNFKSAYWTVAHMLTQHTVNGCPLRSGDLLGTGTLSGPAEHEAAALIELTHGGQNPIDLGNGETRTYLQDGDEIKMSAYCQVDGRPRLGFGHVRAQVLPAL
ncbi:MAG: fumarylacetoacetase [Formosimonas sp.]